jgi:hypothetical protein
MERLDLYELASIFRVDGLNKNFGSWVLVTHRVSFDINSAGITYMLLNM